jgi:hypothetical protein
VDATFVQKISNFWWTCGLVLASRRTNFYKIPIFGDTVMPQKHIFLVMQAVSSNQKPFYFLTFLGWIFFHKSLTKFLDILSTWKSSKTSTLVEKCWKINYIVSKVFCKEFWILRRCIWSFNISLLRLMCLRTFSSWWYGQNILVFEIWALWSSHLMEFLTLRFKKTHKQVRCKELKKWSRF